MEIWLVRHGETEWSKSGQHTSVTDIDLTENGIAQALALKPKLAGVEFGRVLTSPRIRARHTAELAGFGDAEADDRMQEWNYGAGEGLTSAQIRAHIPDWRIWTHGAPVIGEQPRTGESKPAIAARLYSLLSDIRESGVERTLCFAHGHSLRALATVWCEFPIEAGSHFPLSTATVSVLGFEKVTPAILRWNA